MSHDLLRSGHDLDLDLDLGHCFYLVKSEGRASTEPKVIAEKVFRKKRLFLQFLLS